MEAVLINLITFASIVAAITMALAAVVIGNSETLAKYTPQITLVAGILVGFVSVPITDLVLIDRLYAGFLGGLIAAGALNVESIKTIFTARNGGK